MSEYASFTSLAFIFRFLPLFLLIYYLIPKKYKNIAALAGSLVFYAMAEPLYILLLIGLIVINYILARNAFTVSGKALKHEKVKKRKLFMTTAVVSDAAVLVFFKAAGFTGASAFYMPLGLSFFIFKMISYQIDVYKNDIYDTPTFLSSALYFSLFPQISQGPIMRYDDGDFYKEKEIKLKDIEEGLKYFIAGLAMKVILADRIGILWNDLKMYGYDSISPFLAWLGAYSYSFELYFDFFGYSLMASGIMVMLGYDFIRNFDSPYASVTVSEFYRRWHMTLGSFFRDYVYFPMGGSRCTKKRTVLNLAVVWLLTGFWHGNGINFILWGAVLGIFVIAEKLLYGKFLEKHRLLGHIYLLFVIPVTWVIFAINDLKSLGLYMSRLFPFWGNADYVSFSDVLEYLNDYKWLLIASVILCIPTVIKFFDTRKKGVAAIIALTVLFWTGIYFCASSVNNPFMYLVF